MLHWNDIQSRLLSGKRYINHIKNRRERLIHQSYYQAYSPNLEIIQQIQNLQAENHLTLKILTLGASWCKTCAHVKTALMKITEKINTPFIELYLLGGVKTRLNGSNNSMKWAKKSPPEFNDPKFKVNQIPMVYIFDQVGNLIVSIEKYPPNGQSYEEFLLDIIKKEK